MPTAMAYLRPSGTAVITASRKPTTLTATKKRPARKLANRASGHVKPMPMGTTPQTVNAKKKLWPMAGARAIG